MWHCKRKQRIALSNGTRNFKRSTGRDFWAFWDLGLDMQAYKVLGNIMSLTGGFCSISCSVLLPIIIYVLLFQSRSGKLVLGSLYVLLAFGLFLLTLTTYQNIVEIVHKSKSENSLSLVNELSGDFLGCGKQTIMPFLASFMCPVQWGLQSQTDFKLFKV